MRKLMKRYERVELQYNLNNVRNQILQDDDSFEEAKPKDEAKIEGEEPQS